MYRLDDVLEALFRLVLGRARTLFVAQEAVVARLVGLKVGVLLSPGEYLAANRLVQSGVQ